MPLVLDIKHPIFIALILLHLLLCSSDLYLVVVLCVHSPLYLHCTATTHHVAKDRYLHEYFLSLSLFDWGHLLLMRHPYSHYYHT